MPEYRTALKPPSGLSVVDEPWDGPKMVSRLSNEAGEATYRKAFLYLNSEADPDTKGTYKFPYRMVDTDGNLGDANQRALQAIIGVLNGAMGGAKGISDSDRTAIYGSAKRLLKKAGLTDDDIPDLKSRAARQGFERRFVPLTMTRDLEIREQQNSIHISGHGAVFNTETVIGYWFREMVAPGAFKRTIENGTDVTSLFNHDRNYILGRRSSGTLKELREDDIGLYYLVEAPKTTWADDLITSIQRRDIFGNSFGFRTIQDEEDISEPEKLPLRILQEVHLYDVGPVTEPAYPETDVDARQQHIDTRAKQKSGIDVRHLSRILSRLENNRPVTRTDHQQLQSMIAQLSQIAADPPQGRHFVAIQRELRRYQLLEQEMKARV